MNSLKFASLGVAMVAAFHLTALPADTRSPAGTAPPQATPLIPLMSDYHLAASEPSPPPVDVQDADADPNALPPLVVEGGPLAPPISEHAVNTPDGLAALAEKKYFRGATAKLNAFTLPLFGQSRQEYALQRYHEDRRVRQLAELDDTIDRIRAADPTAAADLESVADATFIREWLPEPGS